jgi:hypothetical protein
MDFRPVNPRLGEMSFGRKGLNLAMLTNPTQRTKTAGALKMEIDANRKGADAMIWTSVAAMPSELETIIRGVSALSLEVFPLVGTDFYGDLKAYISGLGFSSFLQTHKEGFTPHPMFTANFTTVEDGEKLADSPLFLSVNFRAVENPQVYRDFFGADYETIKGRSILLGTDSPWLKLGSYSIVAAIVHELGCVKLTEQAQKQGWKGSEMSMGAQYFYAHAYSYNFLYFMSQLLRSGEKGLPPISREDSLNLEHTFLELFRRAMIGFDRMEKPERAKYLLSARSKCADRSA